MSNILLTGGNGFLGSFVLPRLLVDHQVVLIHRSESDLSRISDYLPLVKTFNISTEDIENAYEKYNIDCVIHLATNYGRTSSVSNVFKVNFELPLKLLELSLKHNVKSFVNTDTFTSKINSYNYLPYYHYSKRYFKEVAESIIKNGKGNLSFVTVFPYHLYGPTDNPNKFIPSIILDLLKKKQDINLTSGLQKRDFIYVKDLASAYPLLINMDFGLHDIDIGSAKSYSIQELVRLIKSLTANDKTNLNFGKLELRQNEIMDAKSDNNEIMKLGWQPQYNLNQGLIETIEFYQNDFTE